MNQILISEKLYVTPEIIRKKKLYKIEFFISIFLVVALFSYYIYAEYDKKKFANVSTENLDLETEEEKKEVEKSNKEAKDLFTKMKEVLSGEVKDIRFTKKLKNHPVCLTSEGQITVEMEKVINAMPTDETVKAEKVLEINESHPIVNKLKDLYKKDKLSATHA